MIEPCGFDSSQGLVANSDCQDSCLSAGCTSAERDNQVCDLNCNIPECAFDSGNCSFCADGCQKSDLEDSIANENCNNMNCYYDSSVFKECSPGCTNALLLNDVCDPECNTSLCAFDYGLCNGIITECASGCPSTLQGNGICNESCNNPNCSYDDYDCLCAPECTPELLTNTQCDSVCNFRNCEYDAGNCNCNCDSTDGLCDESCWNENCGWADSDCGCADNCKNEEIATCKAECLVSGCDTSLCTDTTKIELAEAYQKIRASFYASVSIEECTEASSECTEDKLRNDPCFVNENGEYPCKVIECGYALGKCDSCTDDCGDGARCHIGSTEVICITCVGKKQFFSSCLDQCPYGYQEDSNNICVLASDSSTAESPTVLYVDSTKTDTGYFPTLADALLGIYTKYTTIQLAENTAYTLSSVSNDNPLRILLSDLKEPLKREFSPEKILIEGNQSTIQIESEDFCVFHMSSGTIEFRSVTFKTISVNSSCNESCTFCSDEGCGSNCDPDCEHFKPYYFIDISSEGTLILDNVQFDNMRNNFKALIFLDGANAQLTNVDFKQVKADSDSDSGVIVNECSDSIENCGDFTYSGGTVELLNDGFPIEDEVSEYHQFSGFIKFDRINNASIEQVNFSLNIVYVNPLLSIEEFNTFSIDQCSFDRNMLFSGLLIIDEPKDIDFSFVPGTNNTIHEFTYDHLTVSNTNFTSNYIGSNAIIYFIYELYLQNINLNGLYFYNNVVSDGGEIYGIMANSEDLASKVGFDKVYVDGFRKLGYYTERTAKFTDITFEYTVLGRYGAIYLTNFAKIEINNLTFDNIQNRVVDLTEFIITYFTENTSSFVTEHEDVQTYISNSYVANIDKAFSVEINSLTLKNSTIATAEMLFVDIPTVNISYANIQDVSISETPGILVMDNVDEFHLLHSQFTNNENTYTNGKPLIYLKSIGDDVAYMQNNTFEENRGENAACIYSQIAELHISDSHFLRNNGTGVSATTIFFTVASSSVLSITNTNFTGNLNEEGKGGGLYIIDGSDGEELLSLTINNCTFLQNMVNMKGGAIYISTDVQLAENSTIESTDFYENYSEYGVLTFLCAGELTIKSCNFLYNSGEIASVIANEGEEDFDLKLEDSLISDNYNADVIRVIGGTNWAQISTKNCVIQNHSSRPLYVNHGIWQDDSSVIDNNVITNEIDPGSTCIASCSFILKNTQFLNNDAQLGAALFLNTRSHLQCTDCYFYRNSAYGEGGALFLDLSHATISNSKFIENESRTGYGGAIHLSNSFIDTTEITSTEIARNRASKGFSFIASLCKLRLTSVYIHENTSTIGGTGVKIDLSEVEIFSSNFYDSVSTQGTGISTSNSRVDVYNSNFYNNIANSKGGGMKVSSSVSYISGCHFYELSAPEGAAIYAISGSEIYITNSEFYNMHEHIGMIYGIDAEIRIADSVLIDYTGAGISCSGCSTVSVENTLFENGIGASGTGIITDDSILVSLKNDTFRNMQSSNQGTIYVESSDPCVLSVQESSFINNKALTGGGISTDAQTVEILHNYFQGNTAFNNTANDEKLAEKTEGIGGAILLRCGMATCTHEVKHNTFTNNSAVYNGGGINWYDVKPELANNTFSGNTAVYGPDISSYPVTVSSVSTSRRLSTPVLSSVASGQDIIDSLVLALVDHYGQIVSSDSESKAVLSSSINGTSVTGNTLFEAVNGVYNLTGVKVIATPDSTTQLIFTTTAISASKAQSAGDNITYDETISITTEMRACEIGEVTSRNECVECAAGLFSLDPTDTDCSICPSGATCDGLGNIAPNPGYWRSSNTSSVVWACPNTDACIGSNGATNSIGECATGYKGNKCQSCELGYSRSALNMCSVCPSHTGNIFKLVGMIIIGTGVAVILVRSSLKSVYKPKAMHSVFLKILVSYLQLVMMTATFELDWPSYVQELFSVQELAGSASDQILSIDCFLEDEEGSTDMIFFHKVVFMSMLPFIVIFFSLCFWGGFAMYYQKKSYLKEELVSTIIVLIFLILPNVIKLMFKVLNCKEIESGEFWLVEDLDVRCWDETHKMHAMAFAIPGILLWGLIIPLLVLGLLFKNRKKLHKVSVRKKYGFLCNGYSKREYYWEVVITFRKFFILCCAVIIANISTQIQALSVMFLILLCIYLQSKFTPYTQANLNQTELRAIMVAAITIYSGLFYLTNDLDEITKLVLFLVIVTANIYFLVFWIRDFCGIGLTALFSRIPILKRCLKTTKDGLRDDIFKLEENLPHVIGKGTDKMYRLYTESHCDNTTVTAVNCPLKMNELFLDIIHRENHEELNKYAFEIV